MTSRASRAEASARRPGRIEHGDLGLGDAAQDPLDQGRPEEAGGPGDEESLPTEIPLDGHPEMSTTGDPILSTIW